MIVVNTSYQRAPWADVLYACDETWWDHYFAHVATNFAGELWTVSEAARQHYGVRWMLGVDGSGLSPDPTYLHTGMNSGYQAIGLARWLGARFLTLLGFDFCTAPDGRKHWHGNHPKGLGQGVPSRYPTWARAMEQMAHDLKRDRIEVINASRRTALRCFPRRDLTEALCA